MNQNKGRGRGMSFVLIVVIMMAMLYMFNSVGGNTEEYSRVVEKFEKLEVSKFTLNLGSGKLTYSLKENPKAQIVYSVPDVELFIIDVSDSITRYNEANPTARMEYNYERPSNFWPIVSTLLPIIMIAGLMVFFYISMNQQGGGGRMNVGRAKTRNPDEGRKATFADVAGADEEKEELVEIVEYLKNPSKFNALGAKIPKGVLLVGPPGTGKTLLARAVAGEAGVPFYSISGSDFVELYVGVGASRVRDLFEKAKKTCPSIIFIDELDAVGRQRGAGLGGGSDEREQTLNQLLVEMDGFSGKEGVIVMAATNRVDILDKALMRPGRFDREVFVGYPDVKGREEILKVHSRGKPFGPDIDFATIAKSTVGFTGADLENLLNEAALLAARKGRKAIIQDDIEEASIKVIAGPEKKSRVINEKERKLTAFHEAGHAVATFVANPEELVHQISIIPRGQAGGYTINLPDEELNYRTRGQMMNVITVLLGGRVSETLVLDDISTGASNDLERATAIARSMVTKYGFSESMGPIVYESHDEVFLGRDFGQSRLYSENIAREIDSEIKSIISKSFERCKSILIDNMDKLNAVAQLLLEKEKIDGEEFKLLMSGKPQAESSDNDLETAKNLVIDEDSKNDSKSEAAPK